MLPQKGCVYVEFSGKRSGVIYGGKTTSGRRVAWFKASMASALYSRKSKGVNSE